MSIFGGGGTKAKQPTAALGLDIQTAEYGKPITVVFGRNKMAGVVIWYGQFKAIAHKEKPAGSKGGAPKSLRYSYTASYMVAVCEGVSTVNKVYDGSAERTVAGVGATAFTGALGQSVWSNLAGLEAVGYSGTSLLAFQNKDLGDQPSLPNLSMEVDGLNQFNAAGGIYDANPADIITTICTDTKVGVAFAGLADLTRYSTYCKANSLFLSPVYDTQQAALQVIADLLKYTNSAGWYSEGKLKIEPYGDTAVTGNGVTFSPAVTPVADLGPNDFMTNGPGPAVQIRIKSPADSMNIVRLEIKERGQKYRSVPATAFVDQDIVSTGTRADTSESVPMITSLPVGRFVAQNLVQRSYYVRNRYEFRLSWRWCDLEPMDVVTLTDPNCGMTLFPVRIIEVGEDDHGLLSVIAEELPDGIGHAATYTTQPGSGANTDANVDPGAITAPYIFRAPGFLVSAGAPEIWVAINAVNPLWGSCDIFMSRDGSNYTYLATTTKKAAYGTTGTALAAGTDPETSALRVALNGAASLLGCTATECDQFVTMSMVEAEVMSYQSASLVAAGTYDLGTRRRRAGYGTANVAHASGVPFVRLDDNIIRIPIDPSQLGTTVYLKFLSYNAFGQTPRTLATETAYTYVVGSSVEFPDVPAIPGSFTATSVADGVNLTWANVNPAAVAATTIEYAPASTGPWTVLGQEGSTSTTFHHAFPTGATYFYRARARGWNVAGGFSAYTATISSTGVNTTAAISAAQTAANNAQASANAANADIANIVSDNLLTPDEKPRIIQDRDEITAEQSGIDAQATTYGVTTEKTAYDASVTALTSYLATLTTPYLWSDLAAGHNTTIVGATFRQKFLDVYAARQTLLQKIADKVTAGNLAGSGVNLFQDQSSTFENVTLPAGVGASRIAVSRVTGVITSALRFTVTAGAGVPYSLVGSNSDGAYRPNALKKVIVSFWARASLASDTFYVSVRETASPYAQAQGPNFSATTGTFTRYSFLIDLGAGFVSNEMHMLFAFNTGAAGSYLDVDGIMIEEAIGTLNVPSAYMRGPILHLDNLNDGLLYSKPLATRISVGRPFIDFTEGTNLNKNIDNISDGGNYSRPLATRISAGKPIVDFSEGIHYNKNLDYMGDGGTYSRVRGAAIANGVPRGISQGKNALPNPNFTSNFGGYTLGVYIVAGANIIDEWVAENAALCNGFYMNSTYGRGTSNSIFFYANGQSIPANSSVYSQFGSQAKIPVRAGDTVTFSGYGRQDYSTGVPAGLGVGNVPQFRFYDVNDATVGSGPGADIGPRNAGMAGVYGFFTYSAVVPAGAVYGRVVIYTIANNNTAAAIAFTAGSMQMGYDDLSVTIANNLDTEVVDGTTYGRPVQTRLNAGKPVVNFTDGIHINQNVDNVADGVTYVRPLGTRINAGKPFIDFSEGTNLNKNIDNVSDGATYNRPLATRINAGKPVVDFGEAIHFNKNEDNIADGTTYNRILASELTSGQHKLGVAGSNKRIGDQRQLPQLKVTNLGAKVSASVSYTAAAGTPATATVSVAGFNVPMGSITIGYLASSVSVTGTSGTTTTFYLYRDDPTYAGGSTGALGASTNGLDMYSNDGRLFIGAVDIVFPASGTSSATPPPPSGGSTCVTENMWLADGLRAIDAERGVLLDCLNLPTSDKKFKRAIAGLEYGTVDCVRITTEDGAILDCANSTPFDLVDGRMEFAPGMLGEWVVTDQGIERVTSVEPLGLHRVCHIHVGGISYAAGHDAAHRIYSHNALKP